MRDILVVALVLAGSIAALRRPWIGVIVWTWLSLMNPHRYSWGFAYDAPLAALTAGCTLIGMLMSPQRESPFKGSPVVWFLMFIVWLTLSWMLGLDPADDYWQWNKIIKIDLMIIVALVLLNTKQHIFALAWVATTSLALLGVKGGIFTITSGGAFRVWGPPDSFIEDNNEFALALVMTIPMVRFLQMQLQRPWAKGVALAAMLLCAVSALGSYSRGALIAIGTMTVLLWWRGSNRIVGGIVLAVVATAMLGFMPDIWGERMSTISSYEQDESAMGRISAWWNAWNLAFHYPFGVGFNAARAELFARYSPYPDSIHAAHSIYFQVLGNHGFVGLFLFIGIWIATWRSANWVRKEGMKRLDTRWCTQLAAMCQVSLAGYLVGGAFLSLAYFDMSYNLMVLVVLTRVWLTKRGWETEPVYPPGWRTIPGLAVAAPRA